MRLKKWISATVLTCVLLALLCLAGCGGGNSNNGNNNGAGGPNQPGQPSPPGSGGTPSPTPGTPTPAPPTYEFAFFSHKGSNKIDGLKIGSDGSVVKAGGTPFTSGVDEVAAMSRGGRFVFINGGNPAGGSLFESWAVDPVTGTLTPAGKLVYPALTGSSSPVSAWSMLADNEGTTLQAGFADNIANAQAWGNIVALKVDGNGAMTEVPGSPFGVTYWSTVPSNFALSPDKRTLYWTVGTSGPHGTPFTYFLEAYARDPGTGALTDPNQAAAYVRDSATEFGKVAVTSDGAYAISLHNGLSVFSTQGGKLTEVPGSPVALANATALAANPSAAFVVAGTNDGNVEVFAVGAGGALTRVNGSPWHVSGGVVDLAFTPSGDFLVAGSAAGEATVFRMDKTSGALSSPVVTQISGAVLQVVTAP